jgi:hypothetical protein
LAADKKGGPTDPLTHFQEIVEALFINNTSSTGGLGTSKERPPSYKSYQEYPIFQHLAQFSQMPEAKA